MNMSMDWIRIAFKVKWDNSNNLQITSAPAKIGQICGLVLGLVQNQMRQHKLLYLQVDMPDAQCFTFKLSLRNFVTFICEMIVTKFREINFNFVFRELKKSTFVYTLCFFRWTWCLSLTFVETFWRPGSSAFSGTFSKYPEKSPFFRYSMHHNNKK
jgi:hypothetical protein